MISLSYPIMVVVVVSLEQESNLLRVISNIVELKISWSLFLDYQSLGNQSVICLYNVKRSNYFCYLLDNQLCNSLSAANSIITSNDSAIFDMFWHVC